MRLGIGLSIDQMPVSVGGDTPPTPAPTFTTQPSVSPSSGQTGSTFTATPGTVSNGSVTSQQWLLNGSSISTGTTAVPGAAGTLTYQETATGAGGTTLSNVQSVTVTAPPAPSFTTQPSVSPSTGNAGSTFTATPGTVANGSVTSREWKQGSTVVSTATTATPSVAGSMTYQETATGSGGTTLSNVQTVTVTDPSPTYAPQSEAYFAAMTVQPSTAQKNAINTLIVALINSGFWAAQEWVGIAVHNQQGSLVDAKNPARSATAVGTLDFVAFKGFMGDATTGHLDFGMAFGGQLTLNSANIGAFCTETSAIAGSQNHWGAAQSTRTYMQPSSNNRDIYRLNDSTSTAAIPVGTTRQGYRVGVRTSSTARTFYKNGVLQVSDAATSSSIATGNAYILRNGSSYSNDRLGAWHFGSSVTEAQQLAAYNAFVSYYQSMGTM